MRPLAHFYQSVPGFFDFEDLYAAMVQQATTEAIFVEVGCWLGRSTAFLAVTIANSGKPIRLFAVDTWRGTLSEPPLMEYVRHAGGSLYSQWCVNMVMGGVQGVVVPVACPSVAAAELFAPRSCDFVFIDADHEYAAVREDIRAWLPRVKPGGTIAGHDYPLDGVRQAVGECVPGATRWGTSWVARVEG